MSFRKLFFSVVYSLSLTNGVTAAAWSSTTSIETPSSNTVFVDAFLCDSNWEMVHVVDDEESYTPPMAHRDEPVRMCFQLAATSSKDVTLTGIESLEFFDNTVAQDVLLEGAPVSPSETSVVLKCEEDSRCMLEAIVDQAFFESGALTVQVKGAALVQQSKPLAATTTRADRSMLRKREMKETEQSQQTVQFFLSIALDR